MAADRRQDVPPIPDGLSDAMAKRRFSKLSKLAPDYVGKNLTGDAYLLFTHAVHGRLPGTNLTAVSSSLAHLAGSVITQDALLSTFRLLSANFNRLAKGTSIGPLSWKHHSNWAVGVIYDVVEAPFRPADPGTRWNVFIDIMTGPSVGLRSVKVLHDNIAKFLGPRVGFSKPYEDRPLVHATELGGLRVAVFLTPGRSEAAAPSIEVIQLTPAMFSYNRKLVTKRLRIDYLCPKGYDVSQVPCFSCPLGRDRCEVAVRPLTLVKVTCARGGCGKLVWAKPDAATSAVLCSACKRSHVAINEAPPCPPK